jgi:hypothetical protein
MVVQRQTFSAKLRIGKWLGVALGSTAAIAHHQMVTNTIYARCPVQSETFVIGMGVLWGVVALIGAILSWRTRQALPKEDTADASLRTDRFVATLSMIFAALCVLFILFATPAGLILRCER